MLYYGNAKDEMEYMTRRLEEYLRKAKLKSQMEQFEQNRNSENIETEETNQCNQ